MAIEAVGSQMPAFDMSLAPAPKTGPGTFEKVIREFIGDVNTEQVKADLKIEEFVTGKTDNIHDVMMAMSRADLSFRMFNEVKNQFVDTYKEVMQTRL